MVAFILSTKVKSKQSFSTPWGVWVYGASPYTFYRPVGRASLSWQSWFQLVGPVSDGRAGFSWQGWIQLGGLVSVGRASLSWQDVSVGRAGLSW